MRLCEIVTIFGLLILVIGGLSIPLWWDSALPIMSNLPGYIGDFLNNCKIFVDLVMKVISREI